MIEVTGAAKKLQEVVFRGKTSSGDQRLAVNLVLEMTRDGAMARSAANLWLEELRNAENVSDLLTALEQLHEGAKVH